MDDFDFDYDEGSAKVGGGKVAVPEGTHDFQIRAISLDRDKVVIELYHDDPKYFWVKCDPPRSSKAAWQRTIGSLAKALGMTPRQVGDQIATGELVGRRVAARIWHKISKGGATFANVGEFHAPKAAAPTKPPARRTPTQKADFAAAMPEDDIPF